MCSQTLFTYGFARNVLSSVVCLVFGCCAGLVSHCLKCLCISSLFLAEWLFTVGMIFCGRRTCTNWRSSEKLLCSLYGIPTKIHKAYRGHYGRRGGWSESCGLDQIFRGKYKNLIVWPDYKLFIISIELFTIDCDKSSGPWLDGWKGDSLAAVGPACGLER